MVNDSKHIHEFWKREADAWSVTNRNSLVGWYSEHMADENEIKFLFRNIKTDGSLVALEYGCGPGRNLIKFKDLFNRIDGADISPEILSKVSDNFKDADIDQQNCILWNTSGYDLDGIDDNCYDVVFSIICLQHISDWEWRQSLWREFFRVLVPGGVLTFQMGFGSDHPQSVEYYYTFTDDESEHKDVRIEDESLLKQDLEAVGFTDYDSIITEPTRDVHNQWIWVQVRKPE